MRQTKLFGEDTLDKVHEEIETCTKCPLHENRTNAVPGEGDGDADIMLIGEGPGEKEDEQGRPFVGRAGKFLDELLDSAGLNRDEVFITNVVKCRPPDNRDPKKGEIKACNPYLKRQIQLIDPDVICTLGNHATETLIGKKGITKLHGKEFEYQGK
ncbi:MAG: uracil-DNA glycosylase, partial [Thermoplasmatota archaeon]